MAQNPHSHSKDPLDAFLLEDLYYSGGGEDGPMNKIRTKEAGDTYWEQQDSLYARVTSVTLIVPKELTKELFNADGTVSDKRLDTIQHMCYCRFRRSGLSAKNPGHKICDRVVVDYYHPTTKHEVMLRLFNDLVQQRSHSMRVNTLVKVCCITHWQVPAKSPPLQQQQQQQPMRAKSAVAATRNYTRRGDSGDSTDAPRSMTDEALKY